MSTENPIPEEAKELANREDFRKMLSNIKSYEMLQLAYDFPAFIRQSDRR